MILRIDTTDNEKMVLELRESISPHPPTTPRLRGAGNPPLETSGGEDFDVIARKKIPARYKQAEELLPGIEKMLKEKSLELSDITKIRVNDFGGSFTSLRIGVVTANALGFALGIPVEGEKGGKISQDMDFDVVEPKYDREPNIT